MREPQNSRAPERERKKPKRKRGIQTHRTAPSRLSNRHVPLDSLFPRFVAHRDQTVIRTRSRQMRFPIRCGVSSPHAVLFEWIVLAHAGRSVSQRPIELAFDLTIKTIQVEMRYDSVRMQRVERVKKTSRRRRKRRRWKTRHLHRFIFIYMHACIARARRESERMRRGFWAFFCVKYPTHL